MSVINTNYLSLVAQGNLQKSQSALGTAIERLSSGLRINSAKDDAAGQAIANRMSAQITGLNQASRNANDGISVAQTAEGSLNQINDNLQRIRELSVQASNGTNSDADLTSIQDEINQRLQEIDRISGETNFNGVKVLTEDRQLQIQVGANDGEVIDVTLEEINRNTLGLQGFTVEENSLRVGDAVAVFDQGDGTEVAVDLSAAATTLSTELGGSVLASDLTLRETLDADGNGEGTYVIEFNGETYAAFNDVTNAASGQNAFNVNTVGGELVKAGVNDAGATVGYAADAAGDLYEVTDAFTTTAASFTSPAVLSAVEFDGAATANPMALLDTALSKVDSLRSSLGAVQNRFEDAINNLNTNSTNLQAARSRIEDADYAVEVANMTRAQILQQAGTSVLAQANQIPQGVLSLLG